MAIIADIADTTKTMSTTTEAIEIIDGLVKAKIPKPVATKLLDFAEKQRDKSVDRLWIAMAILGAVMVGGFTALLYIMFYLHGDTKQEMKERFDKVETEQKEQRKLLLQILQKR